MRVSRLAIERELRQRICAGTYAPGSRLPLRSELLTEFDCSPLTLQRAMDRLAEQGFIFSKGSKGTLVAKRLPNQGSIALLIPDPDKRPPNRFWSALQRAAEGWDPAQGIVFKPYYPTDRILDVPEHRRLCADLADGGLAGILSVSSPFWLAGSPVLAAEIPRVCIGTSSPGVLERYRASFLSLGSDCEEAVLRRFRSDGRRRVAFLTDQIRTACPWLPLLRELGLETRPEWWLGMSPNAAEGAHAMIRLLCSLPEARRPDCLLITDDNLVPHATAGALEAGLQPPRDLLVAAHANFPYPTHAAFPCLRFGVDVTAILQATVAEIARLADGRNRAAC